MHWRIPKDYERRERSIFCLFPRTIGRDVYWLERITVVERYDETRSKWKVKSVVTPPEPEEPKHIVEV